MRAIRTFLPSVLPGLGLMLLSAAAAVAEAPRVLPPGEKPNDARLAKLKDLNGYFPFKPCTTPEAWEKRAQRVRRQMLVGLGLWPMPTKTPANAVIHGRIDRGDYSVEKVYLESFPGHFVTGNLYRPKKAKRPGPGVLCPHGHWANGRFYDAGEKKIAEQIEKGEEKFNPSGRYPIQARCATLARLGCTVFHYDMVGYADSQQLSHRPGVRREMNTQEDWGYFSPQAELRLQTIMGLQTYNSIRALDWFRGMAEVDPERIGVTGASGGGTQTFILAAIDPRPAVAFPAVMVSTAMQGGCTCENCCYLRVGTGNIEIAALCSPRPLAMTAANDWTREMETKGFPELKAHYAMLGVPNRVALFPYLEFPHNYNYVSRSKMYPWMNRWLKLGHEEPIVEKDFKPLSKEEMTVWDEGHPKPPSGPDYERSLLRWITVDSEKQMRALIPKDKQSLAEFRRVVGGAIDAMIGRGLPKPDEVEVVRVGKEDQRKDGYALQRLLLRFRPAGEEIPGLLLKPKEWDGQVLRINVTKDGKRSCFDAEGKLDYWLDGATRQGKPVAHLLLDVFGQGELTDDGKPLARQPLNASGRDAWKSYAGYTYGYNHPLFCKRVHDVLTAVACARGPLEAKEVEILAGPVASLWVAAARAQAGGAVDAAYVDPCKAAPDEGLFRFADLMAIDHPDFLPGGAKYLDVPGILALSAPHELHVVGLDKEKIEVVKDAYWAAGAEERLRNVPPRPIMLPAEDGG